MIKIVKDCQWLSEDIAMDQRYKDNVAEMVQGIQHDATEALRTAIEREIVVHVQTSLHTADMAARLLSNMSYELEHKLQPELKEDNRVVVAITDNGIVLATVVYMKWRY